MLTPDWKDGIYCSGQWRGVAELGSGGCHLESWVLLTIETTIRGRHSSTNKEYTTTTNNNTNLY